MLNQVLKDYRLNIPVFMYAVLPVILGALLFIPKWIFSLVPMYFFFITVPFVFSQLKAQRDHEFSFLLPISRASIVKGKIYTVLSLELIHLFWIVVFALIHNRLYGRENMTIDVNLVYFGSIIIMYSIFNLAFFSEYYKTAWFHGKACIFGTVVALVFIGTVEGANLALSPVSYFLESTAREALLFQGGYLVVAIILGFFLTRLTIVVSVKRFSRIDL